MSEGPDRFSKHDRPRSRHALRRRLAVPLIALGLVGVPTGLAVAGGVGGGEDGSTTADPADYGLTANSCAPPSVAAEAKKYMQQQDKDPSKMPTLLSVTSTAPDGRTIELPKDKTCQENLKAQEAAQAEQAAGD